MSRHVVSVASALVLALALPVQGDTKPAPLPRDQLDARVRAAALDAVREGVAVFNRGEDSECYFLYRGTLLMAGPLLDHRPALQKSIKDALDKGRKTPTRTQGAFELRKGLDAILKTLPRGPGVATTKSLWDRLGGEKAVRAVIKEFVKTTAANPKANFTRGGAYKLDAKGVVALEQKLVELTSAVTGGPLKYKGKDMKTVHKGMKITDAEFDALAGDLKATLIKFKVPAKEQKELLDIIGKTRAQIVEKKEEEKEDEKKDE